MTCHKIYARHSGVEVRHRLCIPLIKRTIQMALMLEGIDLPCEISVLITNDAVIRDINREYRNMDEPTDVLSFPMLEFQTPGFISPDAVLLDPETGRLPLGEIVLSAERLFEQSVRFGHTVSRETAYLTVHSVLHLLGYDHVDEAEEKSLMREREKQIMREFKE